MSKMTEYIKLLRPKHYMKNLLVFAALFFSKGIFDLEKLGTTALGFLSFCLISSAVYIINDLNDVEKDRNHPVKCKRPIASRKVSVKEAVILLILCIAGSVLLTILTGKFMSVLLVGVYFLLNICYSMGLKNLPIIDIVLLTAGFVIRVMYGAEITDTAVSNWLFLVVVMGSLYLGLGKRRNEIRLKADSREVLKHYNYAFLDKNMYVCLALVNVFYALWAREFSDCHMIYTVPLVLIIFMKYSLDIEGESDGDPVDVIVRDKWLMILITAYGAMVSALLYF